MLTRDKIIVLAIAIAVFVQSLIPSFLAGVGIAAALLIFIRFAYNAKIPVDKPNKKKANPNKYEWVTVKKKKKKKTLNFIDDAFAMDESRVKNDVGIIKIFIVFAIASLFPFLFSGLLFDLRQDSIALSACGLTIGWYLVDYAVFKSFTLRYCHMENAVNYIKFDPDKANAVKTILNANDACALGFSLVPQLEMRIKAPHKINDIRLLIKPNQTISNLLCWMIQISLNKVGDKVYPYAYMVAVFEGYLNPDNHGAFDKAVSKCLKKHARQFAGNINYDGGNAIIVVNLKGDDYYTDDQCIEQLIKAINNLLPIFQRFSNRFGVPDEQPEPSNSADSATADSPLFPIFMLDHDQ